MLDYNEIGDDETWELFARDYLAEQGLVIEGEPGRGADQGQDLLVSEQLRGRFQSEKFTWLVSCKYYTSSGKSVGTSDETNITDRLRQHKADGFIGFYSTVASSSLIERLKDLQTDRSIRSYEIFDRKKVESHFYKVGSSKLALRYFPQSYGRMRPLQKLLGDHLPVTCEVCGCDLLLKSLTEPTAGIVVWSVPTVEEGPREPLAGYAVCRGSCDQSLEKRLFSQGCITQWEDLNDLMNPILYLKHMLGYMNDLRSGKEVSDAVHEFNKTLYVALAQRTLREVTEEDFQRYSDVRLLDGL